MPLKIPLNTRVEGAQGERSGGVKLPLFSIGAGGISQSGGQRRLLAAVTGGVAICQPREAVLLERQSREHPEDVIAPDINDDHLQVLFDTVQDRIDDPQASPEITDADRAVARRLGVDRRLVAAVREAAADNADACRAGLAWAASLNASQLGSAARVGASESQLDRIPDSQGQIDDLKTRVDELSDDVAELKRICGAGAVDSAKAQKPATKKT